MAHWSAFGLWRDPKVGPQGRLMYKIHQKLGATVTARTVFVEDAYLVIEFQVQHVDSQRLIAMVKEAGADKGDGETTAEDDDDSVATQVLDDWIEKHFMQCERSHGHHQGPCKSKPSSLRRIARCC